MTAWALGLTSALLLIVLGPAAAAPATATSVASPGAGVAGHVAAGPGISNETSLAPVAALLFAALLFLVLHPAVDRHDHRLALVGVDEVDVASFR